jgi:hypothetical protein
MGTVSNVWVKYGRLVVDSVDLGYTIGGVRISRERDYVDISKQTEMRVSSKLKTGERIFVSAGLAERTTANLVIAWDTGAALAQSDDVHSFALDIYGDGVELPLFSFDRAYSIDSGEHSYRKDNVIVVPVKFEIPLGEDLTGEDVDLVILNDDVELPPQFYYSIAFPKRMSVMETFGGVKRSVSAPLVCDAHIQFSCDYCTTAEKDIIEAIYLAHDTETIRFRGLHSEDYDVWFDAWDKPVERKGKWSISGAFAVSAVHSE